MRSNLSIADALAQMEAKIAHHKAQHEHHAAQEVHHAEQQAFHAEQKVVHEAEHRKAIEVTRPSRPPPPRSARCSWT